MFLPNRVRQWSHAFILIACAIVAALLPLAVNLAFPQLLEPVEFWTVDQRFRMRPPLGVSKDTKQEKSSDFVMIDYDDLAADKYGLGRWPWDRRVHAQLIGWLQEAGARVVIVDLLFNHATRDPKEDERLVEATRRAGNVVYPFVFRPVPEEKASDAFRTRARLHLLEAKVHGNGEIPGVGELVLPIPGLVEGALALGHILRTPDSDGVLRRIPLVYAVKGGFVPALALAAAFKHMQVEPTSLVLERDRTIRFRLRDGEEVIVPVDQEDRTWINYAGPWGTRFVHYPYSWLLDQIKTTDAKTKLRGWFKDKTVVVANLTTGSGDQGATPFERDSPFGEVHLQLLNMFLTRQFLRNATPLQTALAIGVPLFLITTAALVGGPGVILPAFAVTLGAYGASVQQLFNNEGIILPVVNPLLAMTAALILLLATRFFIVDRERRRFLEALGSCLPEETVKQIVQSPKRMDQLLAARTQELTVMFTDIQGFSAFCQRSHPGEVRRVLKEYLTALTDIVRTYGGTLDKYMGDGILAFFGDGEPDEGGPNAEERVERQAANAVLAGIAIQKRMVELNQKWKSRGQEEHLVRIGINTGMVTVGNLGIDRLWDYTVVGSEVNKAQRLERKCAAGGLYLGTRTYALARNRDVLPHDLKPTSEELKGLGEQGDLYPVTSDLIIQLAAKSPFKPSS